MEPSRLGTEVQGPEGEVYRLAEFVGHGALGDVYRADGAASGGAVTVQLLATADVQGAEAGQDLVAQARLARRVHHPNVVRVLWVGGDAAVGDESYVLAEHCTGESLQGFLDRCRVAHDLVNLARARALILDLTQGAAALNEVLVHRGIHPGAVVLCDGHAKIACFGAVAASDGPAGDGVSAGRHLHYLAPEAWDNAAATPAVDVYAVGLIGYELLALQHPLGALVPEPGNWRQWRHAHHTTVCPDVRAVRDDVDADLAQLLRRMGAKRPGDRPDWHEVEAVLRAETSPDETRRLAALSAVQAAVEYDQSMEAERLAQQEAEALEAEKDQLYTTACQELAAAFDEIVEHFNTYYPGRQIAIHKESGAGREYRLPVGESVGCRFFPRRETRVSLKEGRIVGGGIITVGQRESANLLLLRKPRGDAYGAWGACRVSVSRWADRERVLEARGMGINTTDAFGFRDPEVFYTQMRSAMRDDPDLDFDIIPDAEAFFGHMLRTAFDVT